MHRTSGSRSRNIISGSSSSPTLCLRNELEKRCECEHGTLEACSPTGHGSAGEIGYTMGVDTYLSLAPDVSRTKLFAIPKCTPHVRICFPPHTNSWPPVKYLARPSNTYLQFDDLMMMGLGSAEHVSCSTAQMIRCTWISTNI